MKRQHIWIGFLLIFIIWQCAHLILSPQLIPDPITTFMTMVEQIVFGDLARHSLYSLGRLALALLAALTTGTVIGVLMGRSALAEKLLAPLMYVMFPVPKAALLPILFVIFGLGDASKVILIWSILFFQIVLAVYDAVKSIDSALLLSARSLRLSKTQTYIHVVIPAVLPNTISALRTSVGIGIAVLFFAETYATKVGIGYYIMTQWSLLNYEAMYGGILLLGAMGYVIFRGIDKLREKLIRWT